MPRMYSIFLPNEQDKNAGDPNLVFGTYDPEKYADKEAGGLVPMLFFQADELPNAFALKLVESKFKNI